MQIDKIVSVQIGTSQVDILGTAHISKVSKDSVTQILSGDDYDAVAVELCSRRHQIITNPTAVADMDLWQVIKQGKAMAVTAMLALGAYQQRLAEQLDIEAGAEIKEAVLVAQRKDLPVVLIDRDIGITLKRLYRVTRWWKRMTLVSALIYALFNRQTINAAQVEDIKRGDMLESMFSEMEVKHQEVKDVLITERDKYMAAKILEYVHEHHPKRMFVVIGMGHLQGICDLLHNAVPDNADEIEMLTYVPPGSKFFKLLPWVVVGIILTGFIVGFRHSTDMGIGLVYDWILINGSLAGLGALLAGGHPLTVVTAFVAAPITSVNPTIGAGMVTAMAELFLRKPRVLDFEKLRKETTSLKGWRHNNVARVLLIFFMSTLGSAIGTYIGGAHIYRQIL